jgi:ADP-ribosyl-[dinitrogen reductase] hydrolase
MINTISPIHGCLLGCALGDSLGLPSEGMSRSAIAKRWGGRPLEQRLVWGRGMLSDDTEHTLLVADALAREPQYSPQFQRRLGRSLRWWLAAAPAGVGLATARAIGKLWLGFPPHRSGVCSAGNGAAMRSAIIGVYFSKESEAARRKAYALAACRVTHCDPRAEESVLLVAEAAACAALALPTGEILPRLQGVVTTGEMQQRWAIVIDQLGSQASMPAFCEAAGFHYGVSGYAPNTVAAALFAWLRYRGDFRAIVEACVAAGGDTDSLAAIAGAIAGAETNPEAVPKTWVRGLADWPVSQKYLDDLATALQQDLPTPPRPWWPVIVVRNAFFLAVVLSHGLLRAWYRLLR